MIAELLTRPGDIAAKSDLLAFAHRWLIQNGMDAIVAASTDLELTSEFINSGMGEEKALPIHLWLDPAAADSAPVSGSERWLFSRGDGDWDQFPCGLML